MLLQYQSSLFWDVSKLIFGPNGRDQRQSWPVGCGHGGYLWQGRQLRAGAFSAWVEQKRVARNRQEEQGIFHSSAGLLVRINFELSRPVSLQIALLALVVHPCCVNCLALGSRRVKGLHWCFMPPTRHVVSAVLELPLNMLSRGDE
jgi:hypothetical protein